MPEYIKFHNDFNFCLKYIVGAINETHIPTSVPSGQQVAYTNRHEVQSQNVLIVYDYDMRFVYMYAGWERSAHDTRVLDGALTGSNHFPMPPRYAS